MIIRMVFSIFNFSNMLIQNKLSFAPYKHLSVGPTHHSYKGFKLNLTSYINKIIAQLKGAQSY